MNIPKKDWASFESEADTLGANSIKLFRAEDIVVENRTILKCIFGCNGYGSQVCPPFIPTVDEFRRMLAEYEWALLIHWESSNVFSREVSENFIKYSVVPAEDSKTQEEFVSTLKTVIRERKEIIQPGTIELEKLAWSLGYNMALGTFPGMCTWCANSDCSDVACAGSQGSCHQPTIRRPCIMGLGIRMDKTLEKLGIELPSFPLSDEIPSQYTLILLD